MDEREDAVAAVGEPVTVLPADARGEQGRIEELVQLPAELRLDRIGPAGGTLDIQRDDSPVTRQPGGRERLCSREHARH